MDFHIRARSFIVGLSKNLKTYSVLCPGNYQCLVSAMRTASRLRSDETTLLMMHYEKVERRSLIHGRTWRYQHWCSVPWTVMSFCCLHVHFLMRIVFLVQVNFVGEGPVDYGGPRREFFRLLPLRLADDNSLYFHGVEGQKFFLCNVNGYRVCFTKLKLKYGN